MKLLAAKLGCLFMGVPLVLGLAAERPADPATAAALDKKVELLRQRFEQGSRDEMEVEISDREANAYLLYRLADFLPAGVTAPWVGFEPEIVRAGATMDLALLRDRIPLSLSQLLSGEVPVELRARVVADGGVGLIELQSATVAGIPLPRSFLEEMADAYAKSPSRPLDVQINRPFPMPYGLRSARAETGRLLLRQGVTAPAKEREVGPKESPSVGH